MKLKYIGKRNYIACDYCHKRYAFMKDNNFICDVDPYIARKLLVKGVFMPVVAEEVKVEEVVEVKVNKPKRKKKEIGGRDEL